jgi:tetratricopeptide (TPR) repeat protein
MNAAMLARWDEVLRLVDLALELDPTARPELLERTCSGDAELRVEVERLLAATHCADQFLEQPVVAHAAPLISWVVRHESQALATGTRFGPYELRGLLGRGGMAAVYLAEDHKHHRTVAVKVFDSEVGAAIGREWFLREIDLAAKLHHPHILPLHDSGEVDGRLYYVMPHVEGESLRQRLSRDGRFTISGARRVIQEVAGALDYAHRQHVVHRDIKPENILLQDGQAIVADFGIARAIEAGAVDAYRAPETIPALGTPAYMSPEQATRHAAIDGRTDVYALGCVLYEMLAGAPPFTGPTVEAILAQHAADPVPSLRGLRSDIPLALEQAAMRALSKAPGDRFATAGEFLNAIEAAGSTVAARPWWRRASRRGVAGGVAAVVLTTTGIDYLIRHEDVTPAPDPTLVAVLPFRTTGATRDLTWLHEGIVELLSIQLGAEGALHVAEPTSVLSAWRRAEQSADTAVTPSAALRLAGGLGAGRVIDGTVVGTPERLTMTASIRGVPDGQSTASVSAEGPADSLSALVDHLAARLLTLAAGVDTSRIARSSASLPATRAFLAGRTALRKADFREALQHFRDATVLDSTFALAALELVHASVWVGGTESEDGRRGKRLAQAGRNRLDPADQALLDAWDVENATGPQYIERWRAASRANPDRAEIWYALGDAYYHLAGLVGLDDPLGLALDAFRRGQAIDSADGAGSLASRAPQIVAEPLFHMVEIAQMNGDTASVRRLARLRLAPDSTSVESWYIRWHRAVALGDSARQAFWAESQNVEPHAWDFIAHFMTWTGIAIEDLPRARTVQTLALEATSPGGLTGSHALALLNGGRPREASRLLHLDDGSVADLSERVTDALYWQGDTATAADAVQRLAPFAATAARTGRAGRLRNTAICALGAWHAARGDYRYVEAAIRKLRAASDTRGAAHDSLPPDHSAVLCAALLEATRASALHLPDVWNKLTKADIAARTYLGSAPLGANLVVARVAERQRDLSLALRAVRRRGSKLDDYPYYLSTFLHEEGRLAALSADTAGAVRAYRHYLALRPEPEPELIAEVNLVRQEVARLSAAPRR